MSKRKIFFWMAYILVFALFALGINYLLEKIFEESVWRQVGFVLALFLVASPIATVFATTLINGLFGKEE